MKKVNTQSVLAGMLVFGFLAAMAVQINAAEHPEHPTAKKATKSAKVKISDVSKAIGQYISKDSALKGGHFLIYDKKADGALVLKLDKIHEDRLSRVGTDLYFVCADFKTRENKVYDLDLFVKGTDKDNLVVTEIGVHKEAGKARYTWYEKGGLWKKQVAGKAPVRTKKPEHPEHPK